MSPEEQAAVTLIERFLGRTVPRVLLPDFDYRMRPTEIKQAVSYPSRERLASVTPAKVPVKVPIKPPPKPAAKGAAKPTARATAGLTATRSHSRVGKPAARAGHAPRPKKRPGRGKR
jgi:hypothetical protein